jgi:predicted GNAT family acetyltransferase
MAAKMQSPDHEFSVVENHDQGRFELLRDDQLVGFATYQQHSGGVDVMVPHVQTAPQLRGKGYASRLMDGLLEILRDTGRTITPICSFAVDHIHAHPDQQDLLT